MSDSVTTPSLVQPIRTLDYSDAQQLPVDLLLENEVYRRMFKFKPHERVAVLIDGANIKMTASSLGFKIDYKRLYDMFNEVCDMGRIFYFTASPMNANRSLDASIEWMSYNGYHVVNRERREYVNAKGETKIKTNIDLELAAYALEYCQNYDHIVLMTGDSDFKIIVDILQKRGKRVTVVSSLDGGIAPTPSMSDELRRQADHFIDLSQIRDLIMRVYAPNPNIVDKAS